MAAPLSARALAALSVALWPLALAISAAAGVDTSDEMWFLQVASRVAGGEALYADVFFGSTPLSVWLTLPGIAVFGSELLVVKAVAAAGVAALAGALAAGARQAGLRPLAAALLAAGFAVYAARLLIAPYVVLAMAAGAWAVVAAVAARASGARRMVLVAGALAGASVAAKYTVGGLAGLTVAVVLFSRLPLRSVLTAAGAGFGTLALSLLPVLLTGGLARFVEYGFTAKGNYVSAGSVTYADAIAGGFDLIGAAVRAPSADSLAGATDAVALLAPVVAALLATFALLRRGHSLTLMLCLLAATAAVLGAYPRFTERHLAAALPGPALLAAVSLAALTTARWRIAGLVALGLWTAGNLAGAFVPRFDDTTLAGERHLRGVAVSRAALDDLVRDAAALREADGPLMVVSAETGTLHLLSGIPNPTPFDYPYVTTFGRDGQARVAERVRRGDIASVCLDPDIPAHFRPQVIERAVRETLRPRRTLSACVLYGR